MIQVYPDDITGFRFGKLTVLYRDYESQKKQKTQNRSYWRCKCDCGNEVSVARGSLIRGYTSSCGCIRAKNLIGKKFGRLLVLNREPNRGKRVAWKCLCDCGNTIVVDSTSLTSGNTSSCGCYRTERLAQRNYKDLTGKQFGFLTVESELPERYTNKHIMWHCKCVCGNYIDIDTSRLTTGHTISCGCIRMSHGEKKIQEILDGANIEYVYNVGYFDDLVSEIGRVLRYDFVLIDNGKPYRIIEYDGEQHNKEVAYFKDNLSAIQNRDKIKNEYAVQHNIPIVRIPFDEYNNLSLELLLSDKYLVSESKNEQTNL